MILRYALTAETVKWLAEMNLIQKAANVEDGLKRLKIMITTETIS
ncbi:hypothetical protein UF75_2334 [Desulfosporosinus sp. I2]|nr:hypothetical protein UF75_2334 [Desulfosporosinus sp. I2]